MTNFTQNIIKNEIFDKPVVFDENVKKYNQGKVFHGNIRMTKGLYRTDTEKETYIKNSMERQLP